MKRSSFHREPGQPCQRKKKIYEKKFKLYFVSLTGLDKRTTNMTHGLRGPRVKKYESSVKFFLYPEINGMEIRWA